MKLKDDMGLRLFHNQEIQASVKNDWLFIDTNTLSKASRSIPFLKSLVQLFPESYFTIAPIVRVEFLRNAYLPGELDARIQFLEQSLFCVPVDRPDQKVNAYENAIQISSVLAHHGHKNTKLGDLLLMGHLMLHTSACLLTADFSDFTTLFFDRKNVIAVEHENETVEKYQILEFSQDKYASCRGNLPKA